MSIKNLAREKIEVLKSAELENDPWPHKIVLQEQCIVLPIITPSHLLQLDITSKVHSFKHRGLLVQKTLFREQ